MMNNDDAGRRNLKDFLHMYNKFTEECFSRCIQNLNYRLLTQEERACTDRCATKLVNINHRLISVYMEINPMNKQLAALEAQHQQQQQINAATAGQEGAVTQVEGAVASTPQNLAGQVKEVFGEDLKIADTSKSAVSVDTTGFSPVASVDSSGNKLAGGSTILATDSPSALTQTIPKSNEPS